MNCLHNKSPFASINFELLEESFQTFDFYCLGALSRISPKASNLQARLNIYCIVSMRNIVSQNSVLFLW